METTDSLWRALRGDADTYSSIDIYVYVYVMQKTILMFLMKQTDMFFNYTNSNVAVVHSYNSYLTWGLIYMVIFCRCSSIHPDLYHNIFSGFLKPWGRLCIIAFVLHSLQS